MSEKDVDKKGKVSKVVYLRNRFLYMFYEYSIVVSLTSFLVLILSVIFAFYFVNRPVPPQFILVNSEGRYVDLVPTSVCYSDEELFKFVIDAVKKVYRHDYHNYPDQLQDAVPYFSNSGWKSFLDQYSKSKTLEAIRVNKWVVSADITNVPVITRKFSLDGACAWDVKVPITISYLGLNSQAHSYMAYLRIARTSVINSENGISIRALVLQSK